KAGSPSMSASTTMSIPAAGSDRSIAPQALLGTLGAGSRIAMLMSPFFVACGVESGLKVQPGRISCGGGGHCSDVVSVPCPRSVGDDEMRLEVAVGGDLGGGIQEGCHDATQSTTVRRIRLYAGGAHQQELAGTGGDDQVAFRRGRQGSHRGPIQYVVLD